jgi:hypothetical protein
MKKISALLAFVALAFTELVFANAVATTVTGNVTVQTGTAAARPLRLGDQVRQGDTVSTGAGSAVVLKFDDGQVAALTANSRMSVSTYRYDAQARSGNVLLSLIDGGMRAVTGLIGRNSPQNVSYRAATATIGIRGTDVTIAVAGNDVVVKVTEGTISFTYMGKTVEVPNGQGVRARPDGTFTQADAKTIAQGAPAAIVTAFGNVDALATAIAQANTGPRSGQQGQQGQPGQEGQVPGQQGQSGTGNTPGTGTGSGGGAGGGTGSPSKP